MYRDSNVKPQLNAGMSSAILTYLVTVLSDAWPALATAIQVSVGGGTSSLDPLELGDAVRVGGGACPWGCGTVHVTAVRGMATLVAAADDATLQVQNCGGTQAAVLTLPITIPQLQADVALSGTVLGLGMAATPTLTAQNVGGTLTMTLPIIAGSSANTYALELARLTATLYLDLQQISNVAGAPGLAQPLANDVLRAGLAPVFARLASNELTTLLSNFLASKLGSLCHQQSTSPTKHVRATVDAESSVATKTHYARKSVNHFNCYDTKH